MMKHKTAKHCLPKTSRISCVILNYNDAATVDKLVRKIYSYKVFDAIVLVDNASVDDSLMQLKKLAEELNQKLDAALSERPEKSYTEFKHNSAKYSAKTAKNGGKITVLSAKKNGGYGAGNNLGIRYSYQVLQMDYVLIANPDVEFSEQLVYQLLRLFKHHPKLGVASSCMHDPVFGRQRNGWPLFGFWRELARCGPICRRVFRAFLEYPERYFCNKKAVYVDAVHGSLLMVDAQKMMECGGYDEGLFLYQEEAVLGCRMKNAGYRSALILTNSYRHLHSTSISHTYQDAWERQKLRNKSCIYYYQNYLKISRPKKYAAIVFFEMIHLEIWLYEKWTKFFGKIFLSDS